MVVIFEYGIGSIRFTVEAESVEAAKAKVSKQLNEIDLDTMTDCSYEFGPHWISGGDYTRWFAGEFKSTVVDGIYISYR